MRWVLRRSKWSYRCSIGSGSGEFRGEVDTLNSFCSVAGCVVLLQATAIEMCCCSVGVLGSNPNSPLALPLKPTPPFCEFITVFRQSTKPPISVLLAARSAVLDRGQQIGGLLWSANFPPRRVDLLPPRLLSKNDASMCRPLREMGGGVDDVHCCATHSREVLKPGNS